MKAKAKTLKVWCESEGQYVKPLAYNRRPKYVRCPKCRRRLIPRTIDVSCFNGPEFEPQYVIPCHKTRVKQGKDGT